VLTFYNLVNLLLRISKQDTMETYERKGGGGGGMCVAARTLNLEIVTDDWWAEAKQER
jgi:hypothetical protein